MFAGGSGLRSWNAIWEGTRHVRRRVLKRSLEAVWERLDVLAGGSGLRS